MIRASIWTGVFFVLILGAATALAAVPGQINYQGYLTDPVGDPVTGTLDMEFTIWDADAGGSLLWTETWDTGTSQVDVTDGYFTVLLGSYTDFLTLFEEYSDLWLQVQVESAVLLPRKEIAAAAYGMVSAQADGLTVLITSDMIADYAVTEGKIASGAVTSDKIATGAVTSYKIASGAVDSDEIEDYSIQGSDIAADALGEDQIQDIYVLNTGDEMTGKLKISLPFVEGGAAEIGLASNSATGKLAVAMGGGTIASNNYTTAMGYSAVASGDVSTAMGYVTSASGDESTAMGTFTEASGSRSTAMGRETTASGESSTAIGWNTIASGDVSTAMGSYTVAGPGLHSTAMGCETTASGDISTAMGRLITVAGDYSFGIGLDSTARTVNADHVMAIMGGNVGIGTTAPASKLDVVGVARATQFQDGDDTAYSVDPAGSSHLYNLTLGTGAVVDNQQTGIDWGGDSYGIYRESGAWSHPYPDLRIAFYSGIKMGANSSYGGVRFYNNSDMITPIMSVGNGNNNVHVDYGLTVGGNVGIGTVSPGYLLDVDGTASVNDLTVSGNVGIGTVSPGYLLDVDGTASVNDLTVSGYVGIGTESPATPLDVNGKLKVSVPFGAGGAAEIGLAANSATGINAIAMGGNTTASNN